MPDFGNPETNRNGFESSLIDGPMVELRENLKNLSINDVAMSVMGHVDGRYHSYIYHQKGFDKKINKLVK